MQFRSNHFAMHCGVVRKGSVCVIDTGLTVGTAASATAKTKATKTGD